MRRRSIRLHRLIIPCAVALTAGTSSPAAARTDGPDHATALTMDLGVSMRLGSG